MGPATLHTHYTDIQSFAVMFFFLEFADFFLSQVASDGQLFDTRTCSLFNVHSLDLQNCIEKTFLQAYSNKIYVIEFRKTKHNKQNLTE